MTPQAVYKWIRDDLVQAERTPGGSWRVPADQFDRGRLDRGRTAELKAKLLERVAESWPRRSSRNGLPECSSASTRRCCAGRSGPRLASTSACLSWRPAASFLQGFTTDVAGMAFIRNALDGLADVRSTIGTLALQAEAGG